MSAKHYKHAEKIGPGGMKCPCCTIGKPSTHKRINNRKFRRTAKKETTER